MNVLAHAVIPAKREAREPGPRGQALQVLAALGPGYFADAKFRDDKWRSAEAPRHER